MKNDSVVSLWAKGLSGRSLNLHSLNGDLYSYNLKIGYTKGGQVFVYNYRSGGKFISQTTSTHVGLALRHGAILVDV